MGQRSNALKMSHLLIYDIFRYVAENLVFLAKCDKKNGNSAELNKKVVLFDEMTMGQIMAGFPTVAGIPYQLLPVFLVSEIDQLTCIPDTLSNADPLNIRLGNPQLKPSFTQTIHADYRKSITESQRTYAANIDFHTTQNSVSSRTEYDEETGGRVTTPQNVNGNWDASAGFNFNTAIRGDKRFRVNTNTQGSFTNAVGYVYRSKLAETVKNRTRGASVRQGLRFTYRTDWLEVNANGGFRYNHTSSTSTSARNMDTYRFNYGGSIQIDLPWNMKLSTEIDEQCRRGYAQANMNTNELIWGFQISQSILPKKCSALSTASWRPTTVTRSPYCKRRSSLARSLMSPRSTRLTLTP